MQTKWIVTSAVLSAVLLSGCAYDRGPRDRVAVGVGVSDDYDGYYDGFYGPFNDGYWGTDGNFWYDSDGHNNWRRDDGHHFQRTARNGFNHVHGRGTHREH
jgi:hypothetical protein